MSHWLLVFGIVAGYAVAGLWKARHDDKPKQRDRFGKRILEADDVLRPMGFEFEGYTLKHGIVFGHGKAVWVHPDGRRAEIESDRL